MARGGHRPGGGRPKGSKSKLNQAKDEVAAIIGDGATPLEIMVNIMRDEENDNELRLEAAGKAAPYVHKKQPTDIAVTGNLTPIAITMNVVGPKRP